MQKPKRMYLKYLLGFCITYSSIKFQLLQIKVSVADATVCMLFHKHIDTCVLYSGSVIQMWIYQIIYLCGKYGWKLGDNCFVSCVFRPLPLGEGQCSMYRNEIITEMDVIFPICVIFNHKITIGLYTFFWYDD